MDYITAIRQVVGSQRIPLVYATVILHDDQGRVLLQKRTDLPFWGLPGGVLEWGETVQQCARRELREETGLEAGPFRLVGLYSSSAYDVLYPNGDQAQQFTVCFAGHVVGGEMRVDGEEASEQRFIDPDAPPAVPLPLWYADMIADWRDDAPPQMDRLTTGTGSAAEDSEIWPPPVYQRAIVATVALLLVGSDRGIGVRSGPVRVGESATEAACRLADGVPGAAAVPERLLGVASGVSLCEAADCARHQRVAAWFLMRVMQPENGNDSASVWAASRPFEAGADDPPGLQLALSHVNEGYFVQ